MKLSLPFLSTGLALIALFASSQTAFAQQLDLQIGEFKQTLKGDDRYGALRGQTVKTRAQVSGKNLYLRAQNDANGSSAVGKANVRMKISRGPLVIQVFRTTGKRKNVTAAMRGRGYTISGIRPGKSVNFLVSVNKPTGAPDTPKIQRVLFAGTMSAGGDNSKDKVSAEIRTKCT